MRRRARTDIVLRMNRGRDISGTPGKARRVLIVDPHAVFRSSARALLETEGLHVVADVGHCEGVVEAAAALRPDAVLIDVSPQELGGLGLARRLAVVPNAPAILLMSAAGSDAILAASAGACAFVSKAELTAAAIDEAVMRAPDIVRPSDHEVKSTC
jgi:DNA-binding NarL/FixJ family response regulator